MPTSSLVTLTLPRLRRSLPLPAGEGTGAQRRWVRVSVSDGSDLARATTMDSITIEIAIGPVRYCLPAIVTA